MISEALDALGAFLSDFDGKYLGGPTTDFGRSMMIEGGAARLIDALEKSMEYEALEERGLVDDEVTVVESRDA